MYIIEVIDYGEYKLLKQKKLFTFNRSSVEYILNCSSYCNKLFRLLEDGEVIETDEVIGMIVKTPKGLGITLEREIKEPVQILFNKIIGYTPIMAEEIYFVVANKALYEKIR